MPLRLRQPAALLLAAPILGGCAAATAPSIDDPRPAARAEASGNAARSADRDAIPALVDALDSSDPLSRLAAATALERLTGETLGYRYDAPPTERDAAARRWADRVAAAETTR